MTSNTDIEDMTDAQDEARATVKTEYHVKPLDLSNLIRLAILHGRGYRCAPETRKQVHHLTEDDQAAIMSFDPEGLPCFDRLDDLVAATWKGHLARPSQAGDERVAEGIAIALWREEAAPGTPSVQKLRNADTWVDQAPELRDRWMRFARAALAAMDTPKGGGDE